MGVLRQFKHWEKTLENGSKWQITKTCALVFVLALLIGATIANKLSHQKLEELQNISLEIQVEEKNRMESRIETLRKIKYFQATSI